MSLEYFCHVSRIKRSPSTKDLLHFGFRILVSLLGAFGASSML